MSGDFEVPGGYFQDGPPRRVPANDREEVIGGWLDGGLLLVLTVDQEGAATLALSKGVHPHVAKDLLTRLARDMPGEYDGLLEPPTPN